MIVTILIVLLILGLLGSAPLGASYNAGWGYAPSGIIGIVLVVLIILVLAGRF